MTYTVERREAYFSKPKRKDNTSEKFFSIKPPLPIGAIGEAMGRLLGDNIGVAHYGDNETIVGLESWNNGHDEVAKKLAQILNGEDVSIDPEEIDQPEANKNKS